MDAPQHLRLDLMLLSYLHVGDLSNTFISYQVHGKSDLHQSALQNLKNNKNYDTCNCRLIPLSQVGRFKLLIIKSYIK